MVPGNLFEGRYKIILDCVIHMMSMIVMFLTIFQNNWCHCERVYHEYRYLEVIWKTGRITEIKSEWLLLLSVTLEKTSKLTQTCVGH